MIRISPSNITTCLQQVLLTQNINVESNVKPEVIVQLNIRDESIWTLKLLMI